MSGVSFRARMTVEQRPSDPVRVDLVLPGFSDSWADRITIHLEQDGPLTDGSLVELWRELVSPTGAVRFVDVTMRPATDGD